MKYLLENPQFSNRIFRDFCKPKIEPRESIRHLFCLSITNHKLLEDVLTNARRFKKATVRILCGAGVRCMPWVMMDGLNQNKICVRTYSVHGKGLRAHANR